MSAIRSSPPAGLTCGTAWRREDRPQADPGPVPRSSSRAGQESFLARLLVTVAADEDHLRGVLLALDVAVQDHVDALEDEALRLVRESHDPLAAQDVRPLDLGQVRDPRHEFFRIDLAIETHGDRLHLLVVMMVMAFLQEVGLNL